MERLKQELLACLGEEGLKLHEMMKEHTTFRVGGAADYFIQPKSAEELRAAFEILHRYEMPVLVIGNGSNLLVRDKGIRGAVIQIYNRMAEITIEGNTIHTKGGALLSAVAARAADKGLTGLEFASGIPGSIGGAVVMNAGAYGGEMKDVLASVDVLTQDLEIKTIPAAELNLGYRYSSIPEKGYIVLGATLQLKKGNIAEIRGRMAELAEHIIRQQSVSQEQTKQPKDVSRTLQPKADSKLQLSLHGKRALPQQTLQSICVPAVISLLKSEVHIGRLQTEDVCIPIDYISREHAVLYIDDDQIQIEDCDSANGTFLNGEQLMPHVRTTCNPGDLISFADITYDIC